MSNRANAAIIGASGYTGLELIKTLINHPNFVLTYVANSDGGTTTDTLHPSLSTVFECSVEEADVKAIANRADIAFLALPHKSSMRFAKELIGLGVKVVDLSADYRLKLATYEANYAEHIDPQNLKHAVYGLPEFYRKKIAQARLVANPGCYPTASLLAIAPFLPYMSEDRPVFIDAKSGVSGAGKSCTSSTHYGTINENMFAYSPLRHRHAPEISEKLTQISSKDFKINFVPHLVPVTRGMIASVYVELGREINAMKILKKFYSDEPFVRVRDNPVDMKSVAGTNFCDIYVDFSGTSLYIESAIDNLLRGASSQAVVNANIMMGFKESEGIPSIAYVP